MSKSLRQIVPDPKQFLQLEAEEVAWIILEVLNSKAPNELNSYLQLGQFCSFETQLYPSDRDQIDEVIAEGWAWLERECLLAPRPGQHQHGWRILSRKAKNISPSVELEAYKRATLLIGILHPTIERQVKANFLRGEYETAIFSAFKEVEITVRAAGNYPVTLLGKDLMSEAFKANVGKLTDLSLPEAEQIGLRNLFVGAIAYYKNPGSHRHFPTNLVEVAEILSFASLLLRIVERAQSEPR